MNSLFEEQSFVGINNSSKSNTAEITLQSATELPFASGFLWNKSMVAQINCQGYVNAQFMQPEPAKYSHAPNLEAKTFIQPEQPFYTEHPGRFVFVKNEITGEVKSLPFAPMKSTFDRFSFTQTKSEISWQVDAFGVRFNWTLSLTRNKHVELWQLDIENLTDDEQRISIYPYFSIGYMSWMNQSAKYNDALNSIIATCVTPYQKVDDYFKNQNLKDNTVLIASEAPDAWTCSFTDFVGEAGLTNPDGLHYPFLSKKIACYETPVAVMQFNRQLTAKQKSQLRFVFGPAANHEEIVELRSLVNEDSFALQKLDYSNYINSGRGCLNINTPNNELDQFVNHWLPRQMFYHGDVNRLSTDPQTRNFLQDAMAMIYIKPEVTKQRIILALSQQHKSGQMPDGILLSQEAELKYINQVPHSDHCVWLPICVLAYLEETNDTDFLLQSVSFAEKGEMATVAEHIELALQWLLKSTDERGLSLIAQGDWCDPMNMVGYKGKGVSAWLTIATGVAIKQWLDICQYYLPPENGHLVTHYSSLLLSIKQRIQQYFWDGKWLARGITDDGNPFGISSDIEGRIYLNPQSWAMMSDVLTPAQLELVLTQVYSQLATPYGVTMLAPSYTTMREDVGRLTQKSPGVAENGSVYNHAAVFFAYGLFLQGHGQKGFDTLLRMIPKVDCTKTRGQLPNFVPNYYRGAYYQFQEYAGRSSQLFNTGTVAWFYKALVDGLCGVKGHQSGLMINPQLPDDWNNIQVQRQFRSANLDISISKRSDVTKTQIWLNGEAIEGNILQGLQADTNYQVTVHIPAPQEVKRQLIIVMGVSGSGKSKVATELANDKNWVYMDADDFHSVEAKEKMLQSKPLNDSDRLPWINRIHTHLNMLFDNQQSVVLAYSGLKQVHRALFRALEFDVNFVHLSLPTELLAKRLTQRQSHFFSVKLLQSQLSAMETTVNEDDVIHIDNSGSLSETIDQIKQDLNNE